VNPDDLKRKEAVRALINLALLEGMLIFVVIAVYLYTNSIAYLIGGVIATSFIFAPLILRWMRDHAPALRAPAVDAPEDRR